MDRIEDNSVHCVITSPPYYSKRKYKGEQELTWRDGTTASLGLESTVESFIAHLIEVFHEVKRVLRPDGTLFVNLGDSYAGSGSPGGDYKDNEGDDYLRPYNRNGNGIKPLDRMGVPERFALAMQQDGWYWRSTIIWHKPSCMPASFKGWRWEKHKVKIENSKRDGGKGADCNNEGDSRHNPESAAKYQDCPGCPKCSPNNGLILRQGNWRPTDDFEYIYMFSKDVPYYCDSEAVKSKYTESSIDRVDNSYVTTSCDERQVGFKRQLSSGANLRSVWKIASRPCGYEHYAAFPLELPMQIIKFATPEYGCCKECGKPYARIIEPSEEYKHYLGKSYTTHKDDLETGKTDHPDDFKAVNADYRTLGWKKTCTCLTDEISPAVVLDPFGGTGTTIQAAGNLGRIGIMYELSEQYCKFARDRVKQQVLV